MTPAYSIIIPHYNIPDLLMRCLKSIPIRKDIQVIVVDDNSPGASTYVERFPELSRPYLEFVRTTEGRGAGYARNVGLDHAKGEWLIFADADDFFADNFESLLDRYHDAKEDVIFFRCNCVFSDDLCRKSNGADWINSLFEQYEGTHDSTDLRCLNHNPWGKFYRHTIIKDNNLRFSETPFSNDQFFIVSAHCKAAHIKVCNEILYTYTTRQNSLTDNFCRKEGELEIRLCEAVKTQKIFLSYRYKPTYLPIVHLLMQAFRSDKKLFWKYFRADNYQPLSLRERFSYLYMPLTRSILRQDYHRIRHWLASLSEKTKDLLRPAYYRLIVYPVTRIRYNRILWRVRKAGNMRVVFLASNLAMWKYQGIYDLLAKDARFTLSVIIIPFDSVQGEQRQRVVSELSNYFSTRNISAVEADKIHDLGHWYQNVLNPDLVFYPQPYDNIFIGPLDCTSNKNRLSAYVSYGAHTLLEPWLYNCRLCNTGWRIYYPADCDKKTGERYSWTKGKNIRVIGYMMADFFIASPCTDPWKQQSVRKKRIIWAPHFSGIRKDTLLKRGAFVWLNQAMKEWATKYKDELQFAFKPHPRLLTELYNTPGWGKERADEYYDWWARQEFTQYENGEFIDLFKTSDAMVHDSVSFSVDYLFVQKPVLFTSENVDSALENMDILGLEAMEAHEIGENLQEVEAFLLRIIHGGEDPKGERKRLFYEKYLTQKGGHSAAENLYDDLLKSIRFKQ